MVESKRAKVIHLTKVKKKDREKKSILMAKIKEAFLSYSQCIVFEAENEKANHLQHIRLALKPSRLFYGGNKIMIKALKELGETGYSEQVNALCHHLVGHRGVIFTDSSPKTIAKVFASYTPSEAAKSGFIPQETVILKEGTEALSLFPHSMEPQLRDLGLPTVLKSGVIHLMGDTTVCSKGVPLTSEAAQLLHLLGYRMAQFRLTVVTHASKNGASPLE